MKYQKGKLFLLCFSSEEISILQFLPLEIQYMKTWYQGQTQTDNSFI